MNGLKILYLEDSEFDVEIVRYLFEQEKIKFNLQQVSNREDYLRQLEDFKPDIAIDDGSHNLEDQIIFVKKVYPHLREYGYLIVEDIQDWDKAVYEFDKLGLIFHAVDIRDVGVYDDVFIYFTKPEFTTNYGSINYSDRGKTKAV